MNPAIKNLVFEGGGVKGIAYAGAIDALEKAKLLDSVERVAGTSAGAITAGLLSLGYTAAETRQIMTDLNLKSFEDRKNFFRIPTKYGLYKGDALLNWIEEKVVGKGFSKTATFRDLQQAGMRELHVFSTDLNMHTAQEFSYEQTPDTIVAEAIRASMSIPLFFKAWKFSNGKPNTHIYVDGGTVLNFPIDTFDTDGIPNPETVGFHLDNLSGKPTTYDLEYGQLMKYVRNLFDTLMRAQVIDFNHSFVEQYRTVRIDDFGISATDFSLTNAQKEQLFNSGEQYTNELLAKHQST